MMLKYQEKISLTKEQLKKCVDYSNLKAKNAREQFSELIGKKGEFVAYNFLKKKLKKTNIKGPDLEVFSRKEKREMKENNIMLSDHDLLLDDKFKIQVKTRYAGPNAKFINSLDNIKEDLIYFTIKESDVIFKNADENYYVFFVLVSNNNEGLVTAIIPSEDCNSLIGRSTNQGLQLHIPKFEYQIEDLVW